MTTYTVGTDTSRGAAPGRVHVLRDIGRGPLTTAAVASDPETAQEIARALNERAALRDNLDACVTLLDIIRCNASVIPDPQFNGLTDCYRVPLDDIDAIGTINAMIKHLAERAP